ncbi:hypothetical protein JL722_6296 [Aureococcus anophagefferens]|nr:hypothetical protein JL722_6296 [Aureococcus anophagefferens]
MVVLSFLVVVAVASSDDAPFDAALAAEGARGLAAARTAREAPGRAPRRPAAAALRRRRALRRALAGLRRGAPATPLLCAVSSLRSAARRGRAPLALVTSYSDFGFFHTFLRWALNRLCHADLRGLPTRLGHTSKALSLYALGVLGVADALLFLDSDAWVAGAAFGRPFLETFAAAARGGEVALPAPCYRQFFGAAVLLATATPWAVGFLALVPLRLRCGPKDQPSLWHLVLRAAGRDDAADAVLGAYHDARCVDAAGALTKRDCACAPGGVVSRADATCGYYAAWDRANAAFLGDVFAGAVNDTGVLYEVAAPLLVPGGRVAYLPNAGRRDPLLCGDTAPLRHVKFLRKADRDLDARCGRRRGSSSRGLRAAPAPPPEDLESIEATLDHVEKMVYNHTYTPSAPIGTTTLGHGVDPDDYSTLDDYQLPMRRRRRRESLGVLGLGSGDLNLFERAGFVVPFDWECQTGTSGGVYPCPNGILRRAANTGGVSSVCAKCYCEVGSHTCCPYYSENNTYSEDGYWYGGFECPSALLSGGELVTDSAVNYCEVGDAVSALYDDGESYSANVTEVTGSDITVTYSDDDTSTYDLTESGNVVQTASGADCVTTCDSSTLDTEVWGNQWWNDPYVTTSYINFKVTRYEMADAFGVEFYSTEGDTLKVEYEYETDIDRRLSTAEAVLGDIDLTLPIDHARLVEARYRHSNTRGGSQKPATASEVPSPKGEPAALKDARVKKARRRLGRRGSFISTVGSFSISGNSNRSGNDR